ncbi:type II secretion system minor pseudopilin GspK [Psychrobacter aestuarii]|uniref:Type II secretion system protein K n=1 Tax=Psychrobacter aestuarii TaxID=556327 RepID=A0ABN0VN16_9GAMM|nr:type II secretion system minor pseudopilin GspK [Psychrobacter aestuarii]
MNAPSHQRGMALLTVLLLVVSITVVAGAMLASQKIVIRRSALVFTQDQMQADIQTGTVLAQTLIRADSELNQTDSATDAWAQPINDYPLGEHRIGVQIRDESSRFNINNLYHDGQADTAALAVLERLLQQLDIDPELATVILDYQDPDSQVHNDSADEQAIYQAASSTGSVNSMITNQSFAHITELQSLPMMDDASFARLQPFISAVPYYVPININTASPELLAALVAGGEPSALMTLMQPATRPVFESVDMLWSQPLFVGVNDENKKALASLLSVESSAFMVLINVREAGSRDANTRQRFATVLLAKQKPAQQGAGINGAGTNASDERARVVSVVSQRLWAFRPLF